jgi:dienelactone hydrolase
VDQSGRPGPSTWIAGDYPEGQDHYPVNGISWYEAAAYARFAGKELPTGTHWATAAGFHLENFWVFLGHKMVSFFNFRNEGPDPVGVNQGINVFGTFDLAGNVREWCWNKTAAGRLIRGGAWNDVYYMYSNLSQLSAFDRSPKNGFRCVQYRNREKIPKEVFEPLEVHTPRDYSAEKPVNDAIFAIYRQQFAYDDLALNAKLELQDDTPEDWIMEKVTFDAAYENERMIAYLFLPKNAAPPYQTMIWFPGAYAYQRDHFPDRNSLYFLDYLPKNGIAVVVPIYISTYERRDKYQINHFPNESHLFTEYLVKMVKDFSRTLDYLETRSEFNTDKIGLYTHSWGPIIGAYIAAVDRRVRLCVHILGGFCPWGKGLPEADMLNYLPRIKVPVLMLNGKYDMTFPLEALVIPYFDLLGTPVEDKALKVYESDHWIPRTEMIRETLNWMEKYFGPVHR